MKIAMVQPNLTSIGGAERVLSCVATRLARKEEVGIFTFQLGREASPEYGSVQIHEITGRRNIRGRLRRYFQRQLMNELAEEINKWRPDVVLLNQNIWLADWLSSRIRKTPLVMYLHGTIEIELVRKMVYHISREKPHFLLRPYSSLVSRRRYTNLGLGLTRLVLCPSKYVEETAKGSWPGVSTRVIYNGVDHQRFSPTWEDEGYALCISRISDEKNLEVLLRSCQSSSYPVVICGAVSPPGDVFKAAYLNELIQSRGTVQMEINLDQGKLLERLQKCSVFLHPGVNEGLPLAVIEAMACGKAIIAHKTGG
ncbi:MAG: glycosyltransferase family 4 protein, partial [Thaumarchaeota archaeon]|nr:glycosyltransferase family 4 protein [Nitrososphaerota archaeon]